MPSQNKFDAQGPDPQSESFYEEIADIDGPKRLDQCQPEPIAQNGKINLVRRCLILGGAVVGLGGVVAVAIHGGELGSPPQTFQGAVPWLVGVT